MSSRDRVAVFVSHYSIGYSPAILNLLEYFSSRYLLDVYLEDVYLRDVPVLQKPGVTVYRIRNNKILPFKQQARNLFKKYKHCVTVEPKGLMLCKRLFPLVRPLHLSLEIHLKSESGSPYQSWDLDVLNEETRLSQGINGLLIQSEERKELFLNEHGLDGSLPVFYYPVCYDWPPSEERTRYLHDLLPIPEDHKIALHLGSLEPWYNVDGLVEAFSKLEGWTLVWHGWAEPEAKAAFLKRMEDENISNVHLSPEFFDEIDDMRKILAGADVGIAWYNDISANFRSAGLSSGKISAYLAHGLPILANRYPSTLKALEATGCGLTVEDEVSIPEALEALLSGYEEFSVQGLATYDAHYNFNKYPTKLDDFLANL